jgi:hypothetical protein
VSDYALEHGSSRFGRWLRARRIKIVLIIAAFEAILVAVFSDLSKWTVIVLAVLFVSLYFAAGRNARSDTFRQLSWIAAASQLLAVCAALLAFIIFWAAIIAVVVFAFIALFFIFTDRR